MVQCQTERVLGCVNEAPMLYIYIVNIAWSFAIGVIGFGLLWHRVVNKKMPIFQRGSGYFIRPKPIESMLLFLSLSNIVEAVSDILTLIDNWSSMFAATFLVSLPREFDTCAYSCYLFGIAHTVCSSQRFGERRYKMSRRIDIVCTILIILPFVTSNICVGGISYYNEQDNIEKLNIYMQIHYYQWLVYWLILIVWILLAGIQLVKILRNHLYNQRKEGSDNVISIQKAQNGLFKVRMTMAIGVCSMLVFMFSRYFYTLMGDRFLENYNVTLAFSIIIVFHCTLASTLIILTILLNPRALNPISSSSPNQDKLADFQDNDNITRSSFADHIGESTLVLSNTEAQTETAIKH
ncbi:hypothetical protein BD408DRAFT_412885 [Parasitella parasitica]|nr:hypothetical protein BD408DRAFT_412885 [Parasitella parasitica]